MNVFNKGADCTGIGSVGCARAGMFTPGATVDFQKGEQQVHYAGLSFYMLTILQAEEYRLRRVPGLETRELEGHLPGPPDIRHHVPMGQTVSGTGGGV